MSEKELAKYRAAGAECVFLHIRKTSRAVAQHYNDALRDSGLLATQFALLAALALRGPFTITRLGGEMVMDRTTLTRNLGLLKRAGLLTLTPGEDRRTRLAALTPPGWDALIRAVPLWEKAQAHMLKRLGERRWRALRDELAEVAKVARKE